MVFCKKKNMKTLHFYSIIIIIKIFIIGSHPMRAKENKLLSGSNLFPHMMWIKTSWKTGFHSEHRGQILTRESILMWVQQHRRQPGELEIVRPTLNQRESSQAPTSRWQSFWLPALSRGIAISSGLPNWAQHTEGEANFFPFFPARLFPSVLLERSQNLFCPI